MAICLAVLMGFAGFAVDLGYIQYQQRQQQSATDAAAIAGAQALISNNACPDQTAAQTAAANDSASNGFTNAGNVKVTAINPPASGPFSTDNCAVQVNVTSPHATWFSRLFGFPGLMTTTATAVVESIAGGSSGCLYLLSPTVSSNLNADTVDTPKCGILINDTADFNASSLDANFIGYAGSKPNENADTWGEATPSPMLPVTNPCPDISGCNYLANNPPSTSPCTLAPNINATSGTLSPGCYSSINLNAATVTMNPGLYVINGTFNINASTLTGSGVTIYVTANGTAPNFNANTVSLSACTTSCTGTTGYDAVSGVLYYQVPSNTGSPNFNADGAGFSGLIYAPGATDANFNADSAGYTILVFGAVNLNADSTFGSTPVTPAPGAGPTPAGLFIKTSVLAL